MNNCPSNMTLSLCVVMVITKAPAVPLEAAGVPSSPRTYEPLNIPSRWGLLPWTSSLNTCSLLSSIGSSHPQPSLPPSLPPSLLPSSSLPPSLPPSYLPLPSLPPSHPPSLPSSLPPSRADQLAVLQSGKEYDVLVIGGGVTGCGVALDSVLRGVWGGGEMHMAAVL